MSTTVIRLHPDDAVVIARATLLPGAPVVPGVTAAERIPAGHKVAVRPLAEGEPIHRYGQIIGFATQPIAPGYDPVAATGQVAGGANLVCFTTGRGSVFGCKPSPSIKLATNTPMFQRMEDDMDINCGTILDGDETVQECGQRIFDHMVRTASGERTKSEMFDAGGAEFAPWMLGATM